VYDHVEFVLRVFEGDKLVAMGLWACKNHKRPLGFNVKTLHLHHCGDEARDQIWPEYNELLCLPSHRITVHAALLSNLPSEPRITEVDLGVCDEALSYCLVTPSPVSRVTQNPNLVDESSPWLREQRWASSAIQVPVSQWETAEDYVSSLSSSFRYQLRRAEKGLRSIGPVRLVFAENASQCKEWLMADAVWHKAQWGTDSGFHNPEFVNFHEAWITRGFNESLCGYCRLMAGDTITAGAYFFRDSQRIYFYLGFARNEWGPKVKSGFCLHLAMIRYCFEEQIPVYDFMGGDYAYKRRFGKASSTLVKCRFKPPTLLNSGEQLLKNACARVREIYKGSRPSI
jgi:hypothetical protein